MRYVYLRAILIAGTCVIGLRISACNYATAQTTNSDDTYVDQQRHAAIARLQQQQQEAQDLEDLYELQGHLAEGREEAAQLRSQALSQFNAAMSQLSASLPAPTTSTGVPLVAGGNTIGSAAASGEGNGAEQAYGSMTPAQQNALASKLSAQAREECSRYTENQSIPTQLQEYEAAACTEAVFAEGVPRDYPGLQSIEDDAQMNYQAAKALGSQMPTPVFAQ